MRLSDFRQSQVYEYGLSHLKVFKIIENIECCDRIDFLAVLEKPKFYNLHACTFVFLCRRN